MHIPSIGDHKISFLVIVLAKYERKFVKYSFSLCKLLESGDMFVDL